MLRQHQYRLSQPDGDGKVDLLIAFFDCGRDGGKSLADIAIADIVIGPRFEGTRFDRRHRLCCRLGVWRLAFGVRQEFVPHL